MSQHLFGVQSTFHFMFISKFSNLKLFHKYELKDANTFIRNPERVLMLFWATFSQTGLQRWWEHEIPVEGPIQKGELITYNLTEPIRPEAYEVRLTPITSFGEGDSAIRMVTYSGKCYTLFPHVLLMPYLIQIQYKPTTFPNTNSSCIITFCIHFIKATYVMWKYCLHAWFL